MSAIGDLVDKRYNECRCIGRPLRFERGECFTCGRFLPGVAGRLSREERFADERPGLGALLEAVHRTRDKLGIRPQRLRLDPAKVRRVVIEPEPVKAKAPAGEKRHGGRRTASRSKAVRDLEWATRSF